MSIWQSGIWNGVIWKGSIWKSQQGFGQYNAYFDFDKYGLIDKVSGNSLSCNIAAGTRYDYDDDGNVITATEDQAMIVPGRGLRGVGSYENFQLYSENFNQWNIGSNVTLSDGDIFTGLGRQITSARYSISATSLRLINLNGVTENGNGKTYSLSFYIKVNEDSQVTVQFLNGSETKSFLVELSATEFWIKKTVTYTFEVDGTYHYARLYDSSGNNGELFDITCLMYYESAYPLPYIPTNGSTAISISEAGAAEYGVWADDVQSNFPQLYTALNGTDVTDAQGTMLIEWMPKFKAIDVSGDLNILTSGNFTLNYDGTNNQLELSDGTNTASVALECESGTLYTIKVTFGVVSEANKMQLWVDNTEGTQTDFTGTFSPDADVNFYESNNEYQYVKSLKILKEPDWS